MNIRFFRLIVASMARRRKQIVRVSLAVFLSFVFITGILLFQENMYNWQRASSKEHFGDWFVMRVQSAGQDKPTVAEHAYLDGGVTAQTASHVYDSAWGKTDYYIGTMSDEFMKQGNITVDQGQMPKDNDEIALDWNTLLKLNVEPEIGTTVTMHLYQGKENKEDNRVEKEYTLAGILNNYTNMWNGGENVPGAIITEHAFADITSDEAQTVFLYPLKNYVKTKDYEKIYDNMVSQYKLNIVYNSNVYSYEPWENPLVYNYMYLLTMFIGIAAITYQIIGYQRSRQDHLKMLGQLGATKAQRYSVTFVENVVMLLISGAAGFAMAVLLGKCICGVIEADKGVSFYVLSSGVCLKALLSMVIAILVEELTGLLMSGQRRPQSGEKRGRRKAAGRAAKTRAVRAPKVQLQAGNFVFQTHRRLLRKNGILQNLLIRVFSAAMMVVMVVCGVNIYTAYRGYKENNEQTDFVGFLKEDGEGVQYVINYIADSEKVSDIWSDRSLAGKDYEVLTKASVPEKTMEEWSSLLEEYHNSHELYGQIIKSIDGNQLSSFAMGKGGIKNGDTSLFNGISTSMKKEIERIPGIQDIRYSYFETGRSWMWDSMDYEQMGIKKYDVNSTYKTTKTQKYLYATEYVEPTEEFYSILSQYMDQSQIDYNAFVKGEQVLVVEDTNASSKYDDSMKAGITLELMNYSNGYYEDSYNYKSSDSSYAASVKRYVQNNLLSEDRADVNVFDGNYYLNGLAYEHLARNASMEELIEKSYWYKTLTAEQISHYGTDGLLRKLRSEYANRKANLDYYIHNYTPAAATKVAGVVHLTDEVKEALKEYVGEYGQYTAIASVQLGQKALDSQNELTCEELALDSLPKEITLTMKPNQVAIRYDLASTFASTNNVVCSYLGQAGFTYVTYSEEKDLLKAKTLETMILYGISLLAAVIRNLLVGILLIQNRLDRRKERFQILIRTGAQRSTIVGICMIESVRESLWCIGIAPVTLLIHYLIYHRYVRRM